MKRNYLLMLSLAAALSLAGCQSNSTNAETEALREQITQLQQQISDLEQEISTGTASDTPNPQTQQEPENVSSAPEAEAADPAGSSSALSTTCTIEELTEMVSAYEEKVNAAVPEGSAADNMEQFLVLKQEEKKIDNDLDIHEDELEYLYRNNSLSREEYKTLDRELERLEDRLDAAEDTLEYTFGIDD